MVSPANSTYSDNTLRRLQPPFPSADYEQPESERETEEEFDSFSTNSWIDEEKGPRSATAFLALSLLIMLGFLGYSSLFPG